MTHDTPLFFLLVIHFLAIFTLAACEFAVHMVWRKSFTRMNNALLQSVAVKAPKIQ